MVHGTEQSLEPKKEWARDAFLRLGFFLAVFFFFHSLLILGNVGLLQSCCSVLPLWHGGQHSSLSGML